MATATYLGKANGMSGDARLYRCEPALLTYDGDSVEYVISSAVDNAFATETYLFPANPDGDVVDWMEMPGSRRGVVDPEYVLSELGYTIV